jgi:hypothetical protein
MEEIRKLTAITLVQFIAQQRQQPQLECHAKIYHRHHWSQGCPLNIEVNIMQLLGDNIPLNRAYTLQGVIYNTMHISYVNRSHSVTNGVPSHLEQIFGLENASTITLHFMYYECPNNRNGFIVFEYPESCILTFGHSRINIDYQKTVKSILEFHAQHPIPVVH